MAPGLSLLKVIKLAKKLVDTLNANRQRMNPDKSIITRAILLAVNWDWTI